MHTPEKPPLQYLQNDWLERLLRIYQFTVLFHFFCCEKLCVADTKACSLITRDRQLSDPDLYRASACNACRVRYRCTNSVRQSVRQSVRLSVCPFNAGTMSKRVDIVARFDALVGTLLYSFRSPTAVIKKI